MTTFTSATEELKAFKKASAANQVAMLTEAGVYDAEVQKNAKTRAEAYDTFLGSKDYKITDQDSDNSEEFDEAYLEGLKNESADAALLDEAESDDIEETNDPSVSNDDEPENGVVDNDLGDEVVVALSKTQKDRLAELSDEILMNHNASIFVPADMPTQKERRESKYSMGSALKEARSIFPSDKQFGDWINAEINDPLLEKEEGVIPQKTLFNYRKLAEFGTVDECECVGFTNVYKLSQEGNEEVLIQVQGMLSGDIENEDGEEYGGKEVALFVKDLFKPEKERTYTQAQMDEMLDGFVDEDALEEIREDAHVEAMTEVYLNYFGIEKDEFTTETIKVQHRASMKRFHPDHHGNSYISDFHFANTAFEFLRKRLL